MRPTARFIIVPTLIIIVMLRAQVSFRSQDIIAWVEISSLINDSSYLEAS